MGLKKGTGPPISPVDHRAFGLDLWLWTIWWPFCTVLVIWSNLSVKVDFPWSICAMMQKFLLPDTGTCNFKTKTKNQVAKQIRKSYWNKNFNRTLKTTLSSLDGDIEVGRGLADWQRTGAWEKGETMVVPWV